MFDANTACVVVVGAQWGDEGKGKLVDVLAERADLVVRYQGGANAGHTVVIGDSHFILRQIPSGILHAGVTCIVGNGVVLEPETFFGELDELAKRGIDTTGRIFVSDRAHLVLPLHKLLDAAHTADITSGKVAFIPPPMNVKYCYGFYEMPLGQDRMVGHSGGGGDSGVGAEVEMLWNSEHAIVVLSNHGLEEARRTAHDIARFLVFQQEHRSDSGLTSAR